MRALITALIAAVLFGAASPASKTIVGVCSPLQVAGLLYLGAALGVSFSFLRAKPQKVWAIPKQSQLRLYGAIICGGIAAPICLLFALRMAQASSVSIWLALEAGFTALVACLFFKEQLGWKGWLGVLGGVAASALISWQHGAQDIAAVLLVAAACLGWAIDNNLTALIDGLRPPEIAFWKGVIAGTFNLCLAACTQQLTADVSVNVSGLVIGIFSYGISLSLYIESAQALGATRSQMVFATAPVWGVVFSILFLHESLPATSLAGAALFAVSVYLLFMDQHSHLHGHTEMDHIHSHTHDDGHHWHTHEGRPASLRHSHWHEHSEMSHSHPHWPDLHHRHEHTDEHGHNHDHDPQG